MQVTDTNIPDLKLIKLTVHGDERGFFTERFKEGVLQNKFVQDNHSRSAAGILRGLHYQRNPDQAKLVSCISGRIYDVAVDIRAGSPTFGQHYGVELTGENGLCLFVPAGFAHGFSVLEPADVMYKVDGNYNPEGEGSIIYNDPELNIDWKVSDPLLSGKDQVAQNFADYCKSPAFEYKA